MHFAALEDSDTDSSISLEQLYKDWELLWIVIDGILVPSNWAVFSTNIVEPSLKCLNLSIPNSDKKATNNITITATLNIWEIIVAILLNKQLKTFNDKMFLSSLYT